MSAASGIRAGRAFVEIGANSAPLQAALLRIRGKLNEFGASLARLGAGLIAAGAGAAGALAWPLKLASDLQQSTVKFQTMLGSAEAATQMLSDIRKMAASTPFETSDIINASETLLNFGVDAKEIIGTLQALGDASGGNSERFKSLALVFGQVSANGRLMGGDVLQMVNAGFNPLTEIAKRTGESMVAVRKRMESGGISINEVKQAFADATGPGGRFFGLMDAQSKTLAGRWSTLKDTIAEALIPLGESIMPMVETAIISLTAMVGNMGNAWEIALAGISLAWTQTTAPIWDWVVAFQDVWTDVVTWIASAGVTAFTGLGSAFDAVATTISSAVDWIWTKLQQLLELLRIGYEEIGVLETSQANQGKSTRDRLGAIEAERQAAAKARDQDYNQRQANRARDKAEMLKALQQQAEAEKRARQGDKGALAEAQKRLKEAQQRLNTAIGADKQQQAKKNEMVLGKTKQLESASFGAFNASLVMQQIQGGKTDQARIAKATEQTAAATKKIADNMGQGIEVG